MARPSLSEQLDSAVEGLKKRPVKGRGATAPELAALLRVAEGLLYLPRADFRSQLRAELVEEANMQTARVNPIRAGFTTITPYIAVREAAEVVEFVKQAFGAEGGVLGTGSQGGLHAEVRIGDSMLMIGGGLAWQGTPMPTSLHYYVRDVDAVYRRALDAGAISMRAPTDQDYGDRDAAVKDAGGNHWYIATHRGASHIPEGLGWHAVTPYLHPSGAGKLVEFLKNAFGAEAVAMHEGKPGTIVHGVVQIGDALLEMGEAHEEWEPMPTMFYLYVPDVDGLHRRAVSAGAESLGEPAEQPYGDRTAAVKDAWGNLWYMATHVRDVAP